VVDKFEAYPIQTRRQAKEAEDWGRVVESLATPAEDDLPFPKGDHWTYPAGEGLEKGTFEEEWEKRSHLLVAAKPEMIREFSEGYRADNYFRKHFVDTVPNPETPLTPSQFQKGENSLLYFIDADWNSRLCVPRSKMPYTLSLVHDSAHEGAHTGPARFEACLRELFYWPQMSCDADLFCKGCDVCQKIMEDRTAPMGGLQPSHIPARPFATVSLDLITGLLPSGPEKYTAILVIVEKLTKYALIIPTHNGLSQEGFTRFFMERVANVYGMPERIVADRDKRWATVFWRSVINYYGADMVLSSSHHPQTDG
jgi:hypothetical protein